MRRDEQWARDHFAAARVARLATVSPDGSPHLVPIVFALSGSRLISAVDHKPKSTTALRRLDNIATNPFVSVLVDEYDDDWSQLWWVRADGWAQVRGADEAAEELGELVSRYRPYQQIRPVGPVMIVQVDHWSAWSAG